MSKTYSHDPKFNLNLAIQPNKRPELKDNKPFLFGLEIAKITSYLPKIKNHIKISLKVSDDNLVKTLKKHNTIIVEDKKSSVDNKDKLFTKNKTIDSRNTYYTANDIRKFHRLHSTTEKSLISLTHFNKKRMLVGLNNLGNTCYMNTVLQILIHNNIFRESFISESKQFDLTNKHVTKSLLELILSYINTNNIVIRPGTFVETFKMTHLKFNNNFHQDSQEFLRILMDDLSNELNRITTIPPYKEIKYSNNYSKADWNEEYFRAFLRRENSLIVDIFNAQIINSFTCLSCDYKTHTFEKMIDFPILISSKYTSKCSMIELLDDYFEEEITNWENQCLHCNKRVKFKKQIKISKLPKVLILTFQRYNYRSNDKNLININIKESIDISKYLDRECLEDQETKYNLEGISNHAGKINFGHYYAYIISKNRYCKLGTNWYEFNDEKVNRLSSIELNSSNVYSLFYTIY